ncbi:MAG TPA: CHAT domain-containing protein [Polyangiaceae bacterium]|nr:CHAT domain-containing protein [Polyangiaceae bacterium]
MQTFVLTAIEQPLGAQVGLELFEWVGGQRISLARHPQPVSADRMFADAQGNAVDLATLLSHLDDFALLESAGTHLCDRLLLGAVGVAVQALPGDARVLLDLRGAGLEILPWELMRQGGNAIFAVANLPWSRGTPEPLPAPAQVRPVGKQAPPRILIIVGSARADTDALGDEELRAIEDALHQCNAGVLVETLVRASPNAIRETMKAFKPHILHFIGHGFVAQGKPVLELIESLDPTAPQNDPAHRLDSAYIQGLFSFARAPRLVVANACDTASRVPSWDLAHIFEGSGVLATLAMQAPIGGAAAVLFSRSFYSSLVNGDPVDVAAANGRAALDAMVDVNTVRVNWAIPRLVIHGNPGDVLPRPDAELRPPIRAKDDFVHRWAQRRQVWDTYFPDGQGSGGRLAVLQGDEQSGKSEFILLLGEMWTRSKGRTALHVNLDGGRDESGFELILGRLSLAMASAGLSTQELAALDRSKPKQTQGDRVSEILESVAHDETLILIDELQNWQKQLVIVEALEAFCAPFARPRPNSRVRVAIALRSEHAEAVMWDRDYGIKPILMRNFTRAEWGRAAAQFIRYRAGRLAALDATRVPAFHQSAWTQLFLREPDEVTDQAANFSPEWFGVLRGWIRTLERRR